VAAAPLHLLAQDAEDLAVISAALQDAVLKVGDIAFEARARRVTVSLNRFRWEADRRERVRSALQLGGVLKAEARKVQRDRKDGVLELLAVEFAAGEAPGGYLTLRFAGGGDLRMLVECIDAVLVDVSTPWPARSAPRHQP
jgi:Protein of unknown function (DUF2948)